MVKFDNIPEIVGIKRIKGHFMVKKIFYVCRKQFPIILAFAVTIHKCQGLSLDCAIIDLSSNVFSPGVAYVALSRVRTLEGVHLICFDPCSIKVSITVPRKLVLVKTLLLPKAYKQRITMMKLMNVKHTAMDTACDRWPRWRYYQSNVQWQQLISSQMRNLNFIKPFQCSPGGPDIMLTRPDVDKLEQIAGDDNIIGH